MYLRLAIRVFQIVQLFGKSRDIVKPGLTDEHCQRQKRQFIGPVGFRFVKADATSPKFSRFGSLQLQPAPFV